MTVRPLLLALALVALVGAAPPARVRLDPVRSGPQTTFVGRYLDDLKRGAYAEAYALLDDGAKRYYGNAENFRSVFAADGYRLQRYTLVGVRPTRYGPVYFARETVRYLEHSHDVEAVATATVPVGVLTTPAGPRIKDPGKPSRAFASTMSVNENGVRATIKKVSFFDDRVEIVITFANTGDSFVTLLPYGKSVLRDDRGNAYRVIQTKNWALTDKQLFLGLRLAPNQQYTGSMAFAAARFDDTARTFDLTIAPALREGADDPFSLEFSRISAHG